MGSRIQALREALGWSQYAMAEFLRIQQPSVHRMEVGQAESGPISRLVDALAGGLASGVVRGGMSPSECLATLGLNACDPASSPRPDAAA